MIRGLPGLGEWAALLSFVAAFVVVVTQCVAVPWVVAGPSMSPGLEPGDHVLIDRWTYAHRPPRPGEVALFVAPSGGAVLVKRVSRSPYGAPAADAPASIWVEGDNARDSADSRLFGPVPADRFRGRVLWRYWPLSRAGPVGGASGTSGFRLP